MSSIPIIYHEHNTRREIPAYFVDGFNFIKDSVEMPYIYYIPINTFDYLLPGFSENPFSYLNENIKQDIRNGKCKVVMYAQDEGEFGSDRNVELEVLESWMLSECFPKNSVHFVCMNLIIEESVIKKKMPIIGHSNVYKSETYLISPYKPTDEFFDIGLSENHMVFLNYNKSNRFKFRIYLMLNYIKHDLLKDGLVSFSENFKREDIGKIIENDSTFDFNSNVIYAYNNITPLYIDDLLKNYFNSSKDDTSRFDNLGQMVQSNHYNKSFISLVSETLVIKDTVYLSEKTFKPILMGHPFITVSSTGTLKKIKELGYKTFDRWWDESYDACDTYQERIDSIILILKELQKKTNKERIQMRDEMLDVLKYNQKLYHQRCNTKDPIVDIIKNIYKNLLNENNISYRL